MTLPRWFNSKAAKVFLFDPSSIKYVYSWRKSLKPGHTPLSDQVPWITFKAKTWLETYLKPDMSVFEYGSGGSTMFFSKRAKKIISIEHNKNWYSKISSILIKAGISNIEYFLCEPEIFLSEQVPSYNYGSYTSIGMGYDNMSFERYVKHIEKYPDKSFDLVLIDGRARPSCIFHAISKIRSHGYLMLDNSERQRYSKAISLLTGYKRTDFFGIGPYFRWPWQTSIWELT